MTQSVIDYTEKPKKQGQFQDKLHSLQVIQSESGTFDFAIKFRHEANMNEFLNVIKRDSLLSEIEITSSPGDPSKTGGLFLSTISINNLDLNKAKRIVTTVTTYLGRGNLSLAMSWLEELNKASNTVKHNAAPLSR